MEPTRAELHQLMSAYPRIYFACHVRHVPDPETGRVLTAHQASILDHLDEIEPVSLSELADHMGVTPGTMSVHVDKLTTRGFVDRRQSEQDGRQVELRLTAAGQRLRDSRSVLDPERAWELLDQLSVTERRVALHGLELLAQAANRSMTARAGRAG